MLPHYHAVRDAAQRIAGAIDHSVEALAQGRVEHEPAMTDRMLGAIEESLVDYQNRGLRWTAKTLTDRGRGSQESKYGADFLGVLSIALPDFTVSKGFLAQAKLVRGNSSGEVKELKRQCEKMLDLSPDSFVFLYGATGVRIVPALSVLAADVDPLKLYSRSAQSFFEAHFECFIGDRSIKSSSPKTLESMRAQFETRRAILLKARPVRLPDP
ncbi:MAG: hypothetical protein AB7J34_23300 [Limisphaerales bacterium]